MLLCPCNRSFMFSHLFSAHLLRKFDASFCTNYGENPPFCIFVCATTHVCGYRIVVASAVCAATCYKHIDACADMLQLAVQHVRKLWKHDVPAAIEGFRRCRRCVCVCVCDTEKVSE
jgi:hypothetical protein